SAKASDEKWKLTEGSPAPGQPITLLLEEDDHPLLVTNSGLYRVQRDVSTNAIMLRLPGMSIPLARAESLADAGPVPGQYWSDPAAAAFDRSSHRLIIYSRGQIWALQLGKEGKYEV